jgi:hypothetical protein
MENALNGGHELTAETPAEKLCGHDAASLLAAQTALATQNAKREAEIAAAHAAALPGALRDAFAADPPQLHGHTLVPVTAGLVAVLERIKSPLLQVARLAAANPEKTIAEIQALMAGDDIEPEADAETVYCFLHPAKELRQLLNRGREVFREMAMEEVGELHPAVVADLARACGGHFAASFSTIVRFRSAQKSEDGSVKSPPPVERRTASAGGSATSEPPSAPPVNPSMS